MEERGAGSRKRAFICYVSVQVYRCRVQNKRNPPVLLHPPRDLSSEQQYNHMFYGVRHGTLQASHLPESIHIYMRVYETFLSKYLAMEYITHRQ